MKLAGPLIKGTFLARPNRFITHIELNGEEVISHLPDPGRLKELLIPGVNVWLRPAPKNSERKTKYSTIMVEKEGILISLNTTLPNLFIREDFGIIPFLKGWSIVRSEYKIGNHRIDYLLKDTYNNDVYTEIKSVSFVEKGVAKFPDAVTVRGKQHAELLTSLQNEGKKSMIIFICQRPDANIFEPMWNRDPAFSNALLTAQKSGVAIKCFTTNVSLKDMTFCNEIPLNLTPPNE